MEVSDTLFKKLSMLFDTAAISDMKTALKNGKINHVLTDDFEALIFYEEIVYAFDLSKKCCKVLHGQLNDIQAIALLLSNQGISGISYKAALAAI